MSKYLGKLVVFALLLIAQPGESTELMNSVNGGESRITNGERASPGEFPSLISIKDIHLGPHFHTCAGAIIDEVPIILYSLCDEKILAVLVTSGWWHQLRFIVKLTILTSASCVSVMSPPTRFEIVAGEYDLLLNDGTEQVIPGDFFLTHRHEEYDALSFKNDIAIIQLSVALDLTNSSVRAANLPVVDNSEPADRCITVGWGETSHNASNLTQFPQKAELPKLSDTDCATQMQLDGVAIEEEMVCYGGEGADSCRGDVGNPIFCGDELVGIASFNHSPCGTLGYPTVFTQVSYYLDWIARFDASNNDLVYV